MKKINDTVLTIVLVLGKLEWIPIEKSNVIAVNRKLPPLNNNLFGLLLK